MRVRMLAVTVVVLGLLVCGPAVAQEKSAGVLILSNCSPWRYHYALSPVVMRKDGKLEKVKLLMRGEEQGKWLDFATPLPPANWKDAAFDDGVWQRKPLADPNSSWVAHLALRGKFRVTDVETVKGLKLTVSYRGGVVVYVNGKEIARGHLKKDAKPEDLGEDYERGNFKAARELSEVVIPRDVLVEGTNVLAIEVHRSAHLAESVRLIKGATSFEAGTCGVVKLRLRALTADGIEPNVVRPKGIQVWNSDPMRWDFDVEHGDGNETLGGVRLVSPRGGVASGKVVVGCDEAIKSLRGSVSALSSKRGGVIPAASVRVRYALPTLYGYDQGSRYTAAPTRESYAVQPWRFDALAEVPLEEIPVRERGNRRVRGVVDEPALVFGAVQPVWVTVEVPGETKAGDYEGTLTITMAGRERIEVPIALEVCDWRVPGPADHVTFSEVVESPESVAMAYGVGMWSPEHFKLLEKSLKLLGEMGSRTCYIPLICDTNMGNDHTMVRWIKQADGSYKHDFSIMEKYLDAVVKQQGKPKVVCFYVWDVYLKGGMSGRGIQYTDKDVMESRRKHEGLGPLVSMLHGPDGRALKEALPAYDEPASRAGWEALLKEVRARMQKRGLEDAMMLGCVTDQLPPRETVAFFKEMCPGVPWVSHAHPFRTRLYDVAVGYHSGVTGGGLFAEDPSVRRMYGWQHKTMRTHFARNHRDWFSLSAWRFLGEMNITGGQCGFSRVGGDFFRVLENRRGEKVGILSARYPKTSWRHLDIGTSILARGSKGAIATVRYEMIREGLQECEARIVIERALTDPEKAARLGEELAADCQKLLDDRWRNVRRSVSQLRAQGRWQHHNAYRANGWWKTIPAFGSDWFVSTDWQSESRKLYEAAGRVERKLGQQ